MEGKLEIRLLTSDGDFNHFKPVVVYALNLYYLPGQPLFLHGHTRFCCLKNILAVKGAYLFPLLRCILSLSVTPIFSFHIACCVQESGVTLFWGCPHISLLILMLVTWGFGELANKSIPKSITLADK